MAREMNFGPKWIRQMYDEKKSNEAPPSTSKPQLANYRYGYEEMLMLIPSEMEYLDLLDGHEIYIHEHRDPAYQQSFQPSNQADYSKSFSFGSTRKPKRTLESSLSYDRYSSDPNPRNYGHDPPGAVKCEDLEKTENEVPTPAQPQTMEESQRSMTRSEPHLNSDESIEEEERNPSSAIRQWDNENQQPRNTDSKHVPAQSDALTQSSNKTDPPDIWENADPSKLENTSGNTEARSVTTCEELEKLLNDTPSSPVKRTVPDFLTSQSNFIGFQSAFSTTASSIAETSTNFTLNLSKELSDFNKAENVFNLCDIESPDQEFLNGLLNSPPKPSATALENFIAPKSTQQNQLIPESSGEVKPVVAPVPIPEQEATVIRDEPPLPDEEVWMYIDPRGREQGAFTSSSMNRWYGNKFFPDSLLVKKKHENEYQPLSVYIERFGDVPFSPSFLRKQMKEQIQSSKQATEHIPQSNGFVENNNNEYDVQKKLADTVPSFNDKQKQGSQPPQIQENNVEEFFKVQTKKSPNKTQINKKEQKSNSKQPKSKPIAQEVDLNAMFAFGAQNHETLAQSGDVLNSFKSMSVDEQPTRPKPMATVQKSLPNASKPVKAEITSAADLESNWFSNSVDTPSGTYPFANERAEIPSMAQILNEEQSRQHEQQMKQEELFAITREVSRPAVKSGNSPWNVVQENYKPIDLAALIQGPAEPRKTPIPKNQSSAINRETTTAASIVAPQPITRPLFVHSNRNSAVVNGSSDLGMNLRHDDSPLFLGPGGLSSDAQAINKKSPINSQQKKAKKDKQQQKSIKNLFAQNQASAADEFHGWCLDQLFGIESTASSEIDIATFLEMLKEFDSPYEIHDTIKQFLGDSKECQLFAKEFIKRKAKLNPPPQDTPSQPKSSTSMLLTPGTNANSTNAVSALPTNVLQQSSQPTHNVVFANTYTSPNQSQGTTSRWNIPPQNNHNSGRLPTQQEPTTPGKTEPPDGNKSNSKKGKQKKGQKINAASLLHISSQPAPDRVKIGEIEKA